MRNSLVLLFAFLLSQSIFSQSIERKILKGRIIADSIEVENLTVFNISSNIGAVTNVDGKFSIKARATDTLYIQGLSYDSKKYVLTDKDFWREELEIRLHIKVTELNEVEVTPYTLTGTLKEDTKRIQVYGEAFSGIDAKAVKYYEDDIRSGTPINTAIYNPLAPNGSNFDLKLIGKGIGKLLGIKSNPKKYSEVVFEERRQREIQTKSFSDHIFERFSHNFFVETLKIEHEDISMFLQFAEIPIKDLSLFLKAEYELQLIQYLTDKAKAYKLENQKE
jgi:hypothetical protein